MDKLIESLPLIPVFFTLCYIINQCARVNNDMVLNAERYAEPKERADIAKRSNFNFYMVVILALVVILAALRIFPNEVILSLFVAGLTGLGVKLGYELK